MTLELLISSVIITIVPLGWTLPNTEDICWWETGWVYTENKIYICEWEYFEFSKGHEIGHYLWEHYVTVENKERYLRLYERDKKRWISYFYDEYAMSDWEEDFCSNLSLLILWQKTKISLQKRLKFINLIVSKL